jgi:hypothetical protein
MDCFVAYAPRNDGRRERSPDGAKRNPGLAPQRFVPDFASLHPGYELHPFFPICATACIAAI